MTTSLIGVFHARSVRAAAQGRLKAGWRYVGPVRECECTRTRKTTNGRSERGRHPRARGTPPRPDRGDAAGEPVALGGPKPRALLAVLALEPGRVVSVDRLVEALWPGDPPETAAHAVQVYVSQLRKALGPGDRDTCAGLRARARSGARRRPPLRAPRAGGARGARGRRSRRRRGSRLREALALWRGPALADFLYEPFAQTEIARLEELRTVALEERIEADLALGRHAELVSELEALVAGAAAARAAARAADARALPLGPAGGRARRLPHVRARRSSRSSASTPAPSSASSRPRSSARTSRCCSRRRRSPGRRCSSGGSSRSSSSTSSSRWRSRRRSTPRRSGASCSATSRRSRLRSRDTAAPWRSTRATRSWPRSASRSRTRTTRSERHGPRSTSASGSRRSTSSSLNNTASGSRSAIGIETGEVVATPTDARQRLVTGEAVGIAAKLEAAAEADEIVVGALAGRLIDHAAMLEPLGALEIKGKREPVQAYRLARDRSRRARIRAATGRAARRAQARARGAASIAEARGRQLGGAGGRGRRVRPVSASRASPPS